MIVAPSLVVAASRLLRLAPGRVWEALRRELPGEETEAREGALLRFRHTGTHGWLPFGSVEGEYRLEPTQEGTRLTYTLSAAGIPARLEEFLRRRLEGYVDASLTSRSIALMAAARAAA